jgi:hypothetical protein
VLKYFDVEKSEKQIISKCSVILSKDRERKQKKRRKRKKS